MICWCDERVVLVVSIRFTGHPSLFSTILSMHEPRRADLVGSLLHVPRSNSDPTKAINVLQAPIGLPQVVKVGPSSK